jgi:hypothetical protein
VKITAQGMAKKINSIHSTPSSSIPSSSSSFSSSFTTQSNTSTSTTNTINTMTSTSSSIPIQNSNIKSTSTSTSTSTSNTNTSINKIQESSNNNILQSYLNGNILDPSIFLSCPYLCRSLPFKIENKFKTKKGISKNSNDNKSDNTDKYDNKNINIDKNDINNSNNNNNNNNSNDEIDLNLELYLEKEHVIIIQIIDNTVDCLKFSFSHLHFLKKRNMKKYERSNRMNNNSLLLKNNVSMVVNNNNQISKYNENDNNSNNFNNNRNFDNKTGNKYTGTLPQSLLISANLAVLCNCALLLGRLYRNSLLKVTILRHKIYYGITLSTLYTNYL